MNQKQCALVEDATQKREAIMYFLEPKSRRSFYSQTALYLLKKAERPALRSAACSGAVELSLHNTMQ